VFQIKFSLATCHTRSRYVPLHTPTSTLLTSSNPQLAASCVLTLQNRYATDANPQAYAPHNRGFASCL
jgi:hypothetical protein